MECRRWREIDDCLDKDRELPQDLRHHLETCRRCSRRLAAYREFVGDLRRELAEPLTMMSGAAVVSPRRMGPSLLAAAGVFSLSIAAGLLLLPGLLQNRELKMDYARELAGEVIEGELFEYALQAEPGYESGWFD